jgi:hypothetical protein
MPQKNEFQVGDRVINSIGEQGTVVFTPNDPFGFIAKGNMVPVHIDGMEDGYSFLHDPEYLELINATGCPAHV